MAEPFMGHGEGRANSAGADPAHVVAVPAGDSELAGDNQRMALDDAA